MTTEDVKAVDKAVALLGAVEADLDANYHGFGLPHPNRSIATWYLLSVLEDNLRNLFILTSDQNARLVEFHLDRLKYSARFALDRIRRECMDVSQVTLPTRMVPKIHTKTTELLYAGVEFMGATQLCSAAHAGTVSFVETDDSITALSDELHHDPRYSALEIFGHTPQDALDHAARLYAWSRNDELRPDIVTFIARSVRISDKQVTYEYNPQLATALALEMSQHPFIIPDDWRFPWGGRSETTLLINALCVRAMYHWVAVHFGSAFHGFKGGGCANLLHVTEIATLVSDLQEMSSLDERVIRQFVTYLTYGRGMQTPDPALQPLIPLGSGRIALPCLLFLSSNYERSLLVIQARSDARSFDAQSSLFEKDMVTELLKEIAPSWPLIRGNVTLRGRGKQEEVDLLLADVASRTLVACELRWMLQPGDPREVQQRKKACWAKVDQLERKVHWLRENVGSALLAMGLDVSDAENWGVEGVVVIDAFGGALSRKSEFPIMTKRLFVRGIKGVPSLRTFAAWSQSLRWLPQDGVHFRTVPQQMDLSVVGRRLTAMGLEKLCSLHAYNLFVNQSIESAVCTST